MGAENYAAAVRVFAPVMRATDPSIVLAACGSAGYGKSGLDWNRVIIERCADLVEYLSIHHYENPDRFAAGPRDYERFFRETGELIAGSRNPRLKLYVSEWNAQSTDWRTGLYCGGLLNAFERCGDILEVGGPALFLRHVSARSWDNAFINFDHAGWFAAPNYVVMKLWRDHYAPERLALEGNSDPLDVVATRTADRQRLYVKAVNPAAEAVTLSLSLPGEFVGGDAELKLVAPGDLRARNTLAEPTKIVPQPGTVVWDATTLRCTLPPLSAGVIAIRRP
jgi:alpha-L-arabinofuranosidase